MKQDAFSLTNRTVLVSGASSGIGRACALQCSRAGARVILLGRDRGRLKETASGLENGLENPWYSIDLGDAGNLEAALGDMLRGETKIHGLIHSAGISATLPLGMTKPGKMEESFRTNVFGAMELTRLLLKKSIPDHAGASIVFISSVMSLAITSITPISSASLAVRLAASRTAFSAQFSLRLRNCARDFR